MTLSLSYLTRKHLRKNCGLKRNVQARTKLLLVPDMAIAAFVIVVVDVYVVVVVYVESVALIMYY